MRTLVLRAALFCAACWFVSAGVVDAQQIRHGKVTKLDLEAKTIAILVDGGKEEAFRLQEEMQVLDVARDGTLAQRFERAGVKTGTALFFAPLRRAIC
ncbi:MAG: hypothetical protein QM775_09130 [Pirellulales bacterium]